ncbi:MAG: glycosyltransferase [Lachnospiraceae bacterium]|nr:glycosyltransferase [Lachnospiraceae bacterium]
MITISLCMIVKNEERVLARCLESAKEAVDEIIIVDTGSNDRTKEIAGSYTDQVYDEVWQDDFSLARNQAFSRATMDYCMWLDADDVITEENRKKLIALKQTLNPDTDMVMMKYVISEDQEGNPLFSYYRERLVRNGQGFLWEGRVHEAITPRGKRIHSDIAVHHRKIGTQDESRNLRIYETMIKNKEVFNERSKFYYGRELMTHGRYQEGIPVLEQFLEGNGWVENKIEACLNLARCFRALGRKQDGINALVKSFLYAAPRGEACFELGRYFQEQEQWREAVFWYETALKLSPPAEGGGFIQWDYYGFLPEINLCVCYDKMGDHKKAYEYHQKSRARKPEEEAVKQNQEYFCALGWTNQTGVQDI